MKKLALIFTAMAFAKLRLVKFMFHPMEIVQVLFLMPIVLPKFMVHLVFLLVPRLK